MFSCHYNQKWDVILLKSDLMTPLIFLTGFFFFFFNADLFPTILSPSPLPLFFCSSTLKTSRFSSSLYWASSLRTVRRTLAGVWRRAAIASSWDAPRRSTSFTYTHTRWMYELCLSRGSWSRFVSEQTTLDSTFKSKYLFDPTEFLTTLCRRSDLLLWAVTTFAS